jgi:uncharacterized protein involved in exopolysaccharide biosynthesis
MSNNSEIELKYIIAVLWKRRFQIIFGTFLCAVIAAIISLMIPRQYESSTTLLVIPPKFQTELQPSVLSTPTYQSILESDDLVNHIIQSLHLKDTKIETLKKSMKTELVFEDKGLNQKAYTPIIKLTAQAKTPQLAASIASTWAESFIEQNGRLTNRETELSFDFLTEQFSQTTTSLQNAEENLREFQDSHKLDLVKDQLSTLQHKLDDSSTGYLVTYRDLKYELDTKMADMIRLKKQVEAQEYKGSWIGFVGSNMTMDDFAKQAAEIESRDMDTSVVAIRNDVLLAKRNLILAQSQLKDFLENNKVEIVRRQFTDRNQELSDAQNELSNDEVRVASLEASVAAIQKQLESQDEYIVLKKSITDQALWNHVLNGTSGADDLKKLQDMKLESQEVSPVYLGLVRQSVDLQVELNTLKPKIEGLKVKIVAVDSTVRRLDTELTNDEYQQDRLENQLDIAKKNYDSDANRYLALKNSLQTAQSEVDILRPKVIETELTIKSLTNEVQRMQSDVYQGEMQLKQLDRTVYTYSSTYTMLADKQEQAKIARAERLEDIKIVANAVVPQSPVWPKRTLITITAAIAGFLLSVIFCFLQEYLLTSLKPGI